MATSTRLVVLSGSDYMVCRGAQDQLWTVLGGGMLAFSGGLEAALIAGTGLHDPVAAASFF